MKTMSKLYRCFDGTASTWAYIHIKHCLYIEIFFNQKSSQPCLYKYFTLFLSMSIFNWSCILMANYIFLGGYKLRNVWFNSLQQGMFEDRFQ